MMKIHLLNSTQIFINILRKQMNNYTRLNKESYSFTNYPNIKLDMI